MRLTVVGVLIGLMAAFAVGLGLSRLLYGVKAIDAQVMAGGTILLVGVSALACYLPARRATRVDPAKTLRSE